MTKRLVATVMVCVASVIGEGALREQSSAPTLVIRHATVIDATGGPPQSETTILIAGGRIREIGPGGSIQVPRGAQVVDGAGKFVIPGLMDMHVHTIWPQHIQQFLPLFIANGITGVRDMFGDLRLAERLKPEIAAGTLLGPRFVTPGPIVDGPQPVWPGSIAVTTAEEGRQAVRSVKQRGADFVKVYSLLPREAYFAIAEEAKKQNIAFAGHVSRFVTASEASDAGQRTIEHLTGLHLATSRDEEAIRAELRNATGDLRSPTNPVRLVEGRAATTFDPQKAEALFGRFVRNGTWQVPTLTVLRSQAFRTDPDFVNDQRLKYMTPQMRTQWAARAPGPPAPASPERARALFERHVALVGAMHRAHVRILAGSDTPNPYVFPGFSLHDELGLLVRSGLSPLDALQGATRNAAEFLGMLKEVGTVERGKRADLVVLDANPLDNISNTQRIHAVIINGRLIAKEQLDALLSEIEKANRESSARFWCIKTAVIQGASRLDPAAKD
jgi:imidazolonepropionase-like amidohydrolase